MSVIYSFFLYCSIILQKTATRRSPPTTLAVHNEWMLRPITLSIVLLLAWTVARCALQANNRRLYSYKRRAKLLLAFSSVLILDRNGWIVCWRSAPVAAFCRRPMRFGSVQLARSVRDFYVTGWTKVPKFQGCFVWMYTSFFFSCKI